VNVVGFSSYRCAVVTLTCGGALGPHQARLALELSDALTGPIVFRASSRSGTVGLALVGSTTPAPKLPRCLAARGARPSVKLRAPNIYFVLVVFVPKDDSFRLTASRGTRSLGSAVVEVQRGR
jgi:hypothetical protein